jgi:hypothetical protein
MVPRILSQTLSVTTGLSPSEAVKMPVARKQVLPREAEE